jgi:uncharacterized protein YqeY
MSIKEQIKEDLKNAMKSGETEKRDVLRMLDSVIKNREIEKNKREDGLDEEEVLEVVASAIKQRKDSIEQYADGGRDDLASKEKAEVDILKEYLPEQMSEEELVVVIKEIVQETQAKDKSDLGKVMGVAMGRVKGKADGNKVRKVAEEIIESQE